VPDTRHGSGFARELVQIRERALLMGAKVEDMLASSLHAFLEGDEVLAARTIRLDHEIDRFELELDERCLRALALRHPVASDLRLVTGVLKLVTKLERMGDLAELVCRRVVELGRFEAGRATPGECRTLLVSMGGTVADMVREALDAFASGDTVRATLVIERDREVDTLYARSFPLLLDMMMRDPANVPVATALSSIGKALERIGDEATNVAELVRFVVDGRRRTR
jgi:phosphate transport system protein